MIRNPNDGHGRGPVKRILKYAAILVFWLAAWQVVAMLAANPMLVCGPTDVAVALARDIVELRFWHVIAVSFAQIAIGFVIALISGVLLGIASVKLGIVKDLLDPLVHLMKSAPIVCIIVLLLVWFGSAATASIATGLVVFPQYYFAVQAVHKSKDAHIAEMLNAFHVPSLRRLFYVELTQAAPHIEAATKVAAGIGWKAGIAAELIGLPASTIGEVIYLSKLSLDTPSIIAWTLVVVLLAWLCEKALLKLAVLLGKLPSAMLDKAVNKAETVQEAVFVEEPPASIVFDGASKSFEGHEVIRNMSIEVAPSSKVCVMAPSGSGKTTLLDMVRGRLQADSGRVEICPSDADVSVMFQETRLLGGFTATQNLALVLPAPEQLAYGLELLKELFPGEEHFDEKPADALSGGMRRRVELARCLAYPSSALLLDEPFNGLDREAKVNAARVIDGNLHGRTLVFVSHDPEDARLLNAKIIGL